MAKNLDSLAAVYLRRDSKSRAHDVAFAAVWDLVHDDPENAWQFILRAMERARDDRDLAYLAAGPIEDLLKLHGSAFIGRIEDQSRQDKKMMRALSGVWLSREHEVYPRWYALMEKYGFVSGNRKGL